MKKRLQGTEAHWGAGVNVWPLKDCERTRKCELEVPISEEVLGWHERKKKGEEIEDCPQTTSLDNWVYHSQNVIPQRIDRGPKGTFTFGHRESALLTCNKHTDSQILWQVIIVSSSKMPVSLTLNEPCCERFIDCYNLMPGDNLLLGPWGRKGTTRPRENWWFHLYGLISLETTSWQCGIP